MANRFKISATGLEAFKGSEQVIYDAVKDCMDDIRDDVIATTESLAPHKIGNLERSHYVRRYYKNLKNCYFTISYKAVNPKDGFDYASWTHDEQYKLGAGSRAKTPHRSRFSKRPLRVGRHYVSQVISGSQESWYAFIAKNIDRKLKQSIKKNGKKKTK